MSIIGSNILAGASGQGGGYTIENSLRLRSSASAYLNRTSGTPTSGSIFTHSFWVKRGILGTQQTLISGQRPTNFDRIYFDSNNTLFYQWNDGTSNLLYLQPTQVFRDPSAWYHIVVSTDTTQATASNRVKFYINGVQVTALTSTTYPTQNSTSYLNRNSTTLNLGRTTTAAFYLDGYLTEVNFIDGQALTPSDFGNYNEDTGVWQPAKYTGTYGTNGFYLPFSDATNTTTLAADASGNGNDWTPNNISLTSGVTYDSMTDTPTPYADGGNYAVMNPLHKSANATLSNGNLKIRSAVVGANNFAIATITLPTDKFYFEVTAGNNTGAVVVCEVGLVVPTTQTFAGTNSGIQCVNGGLNKIVNGVYTSIGGGLTTGTVLGFAYDLVNGLMTIYRDGTAVATDETIPTTFRAVLASVYRDTTNDVGWEFNFGQRPFAHTPPAGFKSLHTGNLPDSTIVDGSTQMGILTYTGTNGDRLIATGETGIDGEVNFTPDLVWNKSRNTAGYGALWDSVRGGTNALQTYSPTDELNSEGGDIDSFVEGGTNFGTGTINASWGNTSGSTYVSWQWKAGTAFSNDAGTNGATIASVGSVNQDAGFSIITYTGNSTAGATVAHGLNAPVEMVICKQRNGGTYGWNSWHVGLSSNHYIALNSAGGEDDSVSIWNTAGMTASVFTHGSSVIYMNAATATYVAYCFTSIEGYSKFGSYTGNGSADGTFVYLGFRPKFVLVKRADSGGNWFIWDSSRDTYNTVLREIYPDSPTNEYTRTGSSDSLDFTSNGFKLRFSATYADRNASGGTYIYMAFAENPFKNSLAR